MIAHQDDVLETVLDHLLGHLLVDRGEQRPGQSDGSRQLGAGVVHRKRHHRRGDRIPEFFRDRDDGSVSHQRVAAVYVLRTTLLGAAVIDERRGLSLLVDRLLDLGPGHHLEVDQRLGLRIACAGENRKRANGRQ